MSTFQVPQFIEQKAKIIGPLTIKQFMYIAIAGVISFIAFYIFKFFLWIMISIPLGVIAIALAFIKINGQELPKLIFSAFMYTWQPKLYVWKRETEYTTIDTSSVERIDAIRNQMSLQEKLKSIKLFITTKASLSPNQIKGQQKDRYEMVRYLTGGAKIAKRVDFKA